MAFIRILSGVVLAVSLLALFLQERLIFLPTKLPKDHQFAFGSRFEEHWIESGGLKADSLFFPAARPKGTILFFHGNAGSLDEWGEIASEISAQVPWNVWILDYPGYGRSQGAITSEKQLHDLGRAFLTAAQEKLGSGEKFVLYGRSIGSGIAVKLASERQVAGLVLESPYLSLSSLAKILVPWAPLFLLKYKMRSDEWLPKVNAPILIVHGERDEIIPFAQGEALSRLSDKAELLPIAGAHHNDLSDFKAYWSGLAQFLSRL